MRSEGAIQPYSGASVYNVLLKLPTRLEPVDPGINLNVDDCLGIHILGDAAAQIGVRSHSRRAWA